MTCISQARRFAVERHRSRRLAVTVTALGALRDRRPWPLRASSYERSPSMFFAE